MTRLRTVGASLALGTAFVAGCSTAEQTLPVVAYAEQPTALPAELPAEVGAMLASASQVVIKLDNGMVEIGSGFGLDSTHTLTAGHVIKNDDGSLRPETSWCRKVSINIPTETPTSYTKAHGPRYGAKLSLRGMYGSYDQNNKMVDDVAVLHHASTPKAARPTVHYRETPMTIAGKLFFAGYPPDVQTKELRTPVQSDLKPGEQRLSEASVYGGIAIALADDRIIALTGLRSYSSNTKQSYTIPGDSGEPVFDEQARLVGITIQTSNGALDAAKLDNLFGIQLSRIAQGYDPQQVRYTVIQPITQKLVSMLTFASDQNYCKKNK